ncbi:hypothetical protein BDQ12DRAFT_612575, partial [Crucibulum laeve]
TKWVWRSGGIRTLTDGHLVELRKCMGVIKCPGKCSKVQRPKTDSNARKRQLETACSRCLIYPIIKSCSVQTHHFMIEQNGERVIVWEHHGEHLHERPPGGRLTQLERAVVDNQVRRRYMATAHQLRTGDNAPGSVPFHAISPSLTNPRSARYQVTRSRERLGINPSANKGALSVLHTLGDLNNKFEVPFIVESQFHGPTYICLQTPFMDQLIKESVESWISDELEEGPITSRHGFVTDGDHSFYQNGVSLVTCAYNSTIQAWVPILYTWIDRQDTAHHRPHFRRIFQSVIKYAGEKFDSKLLLHVMDFSGAQRGAHAEEYADALISRIPGFHLLSEEAKRVQRQYFIAEAQKYAVGCEIHFTRSLRRIKKLTPSDQVERLEDNVSILLGRSTTLIEFDGAIGQIRKYFPGFKGWLDWWLRPKIASMIFPVVSLIDPNIAKQVPSSSNAAENAHSILQHSSQTDQELIPGIKFIFLHMREFEARYHAIEDGHCKPGPMHETQKPLKPKVLHENDGRAPDTNDALLKKTELAMKKVSFSTMMEPILLTTSMSNFFHSYSWERPNSCFFDHGQELLYRAFSLCDSGLRDSMKKSLSSKSFLSSMLHHFERRMRKLDGTSLEYKQELQMAQTNLQYYIFDKWKLANHGEYGNADYWIHHAITDCNPPASIQSHFCLQHHLHWCCSAEHSFTEDMPFEPVISKFHFNDVEIPRNNYGESCTVTDYFTRFIPRALGGQSGTIPLHKQPDIECHSPDCREIAKIVLISSSWPKILHIKPPDHGHLQNIKNFTIKTGSKFVVEYQLVGRLLWHGPNDMHYSAQIMIENQNYAYNDLVSSGCLQANEDDDEFLPTKHDTMYYVYYQTSEIAEV